MDGRRAGMVALWMGCAAFCVGACGSSGSGRVTVAQVDALARTICSEYARSSAETNPVLRPERNLQETHRLTNEYRLRSMLRANRADPRIATLWADLQARQRLRAKLRESTGIVLGSEFGESAIEQAFRADEKVYADEKRLGLPACFIDKPRKPIGG